MASSNTPATTSRSELNINEDSPAIPEIEATTPSSDTIQAKYDSIEPIMVGIAVRKDGTEACDCVYLPEEGGYGLRRRDKTTSNTSPWRFVRTGDFKNHFEEFSVIAAKEYQDRIISLTKEIASIRKVGQKMYDAMGKSSHSRAGKGILSDLYGKK